MRHGYKSLFFFFFLLTLEPYGQLGIHDNFFWLRTWLTAHVFNDTQFREDIFAASYASSKILHAA